MAAGFRGAPARGPQGRARAGLVPLRASQAVERGEQRHRPLHVNGRPRCALHQRGTGLPKGAGLNRLAKRCRPGHRLTGAGRPRGCRRPVIEARHCRRLGSSSRCGISDRQPEDVACVERFAHALRHVVPPGPSSSRMPWAASSARMRSAVAKSRAALGGGAGRDHRVKEVAFCILPRIRSLGTPSSSKRGVQEVPRLKYGRPKLLPERIRLGERTNLSYFSFQEGRNALARKAAVFKSSSSRSSTKRPRRILSANERFLKP